MRFRPFKSDEREPRFSFLAVGSAGIVPSRNSGGSGGYFCLVGVRSCWGCGVGWTWVLYECVALIERINLS